MKLSSMFVTVPLFLGLFAAPALRADDVFTFNVDFCSNPCLGGTAALNNGGTVTLHQQATDIVDVLVALNDPFHGALTSFAFNIANDPTLTLLTFGTALTANGQIVIITSADQNWSFIKPTTNVDGAGNPNQFDYGFICDTSSGNNCSGSPSTFEFQVRNSGLTLTSFETLAGVGGNVNVDFAANIANGSCTGMIGAGNGTAQSTPSTTNSGSPCSTSQVPEPTSVLLLGTALAVVGRILKSHVAV